MIAFLIESRSQLDNVRQAMGQVFDRAGKDFWMGSGDNCRWGVRGVAFWNVPYIVCL